MLRRLTPAVFIGMVAALPTGCGSRPGPVVREGEAYRGPGVRVEAVGSQYVLVVTTPTAGWEVTFDQSREALGTTEVYVTAREPNPAYMHAQAEVAQRVGTGVAAGGPLRALVRVVPYGLPAKEFVYRVAAEGTGNK